MEAKPRAIIKDLYTTKETMEIANISRWKLSQCIKAGLLAPIKKGRSNYYDLASVERLRMELGAKKTPADSPKFLKRNGLRKATLSNLLVDVQSYLGGSTSNCNWTGSKVSEDIGKPLDIKWGQYPSQDKDYIATQGVFCDTLIVAVPASIEVREELGKLKVRVHESKIAQTLATRIIMPRDKIAFGSVPLHGSILYQNGLSPNSTIEDIAEGTRATAQTVLKESEGWRAGFYQGYQLYRFAAGKIPIGDMAQLLQRNASVLRGDRGALGIYRELPIFFSRLDITTNLPGAVKPYSRSLESFGLGVKNNKHYVGNTCHTYYPLVDSEPDKTSYCMPLGHSFAVSAKRKQDFTRAIIEDAEPKADPFVMALLRICNMEMSPSDKAIETKIYDKLRYMLSVGEVSKVFTGFNLSNLAHSPRPEIRNMLHDFKDLGSSRVETRYRLGSMLLGWRGMVDLHIEYCQLLSIANGKIYPLQKSLDSLLTTVRACTLLVIETATSSVENVYLCSQWVDRQTGKIQGLEKGLDEHRANNWAANMSNRSVPLHIVTYRIVGGLLELKGVATYPPMAVSKGLAVANEIKGVFSASKVAAYQFTLKLPFTISASNPTINRLFCNHSKSATLTQARRVASKMEYAYHQQSKRAVSANIAELVDVQTFLPVALEKKREIKVKVSVQLEGYIVAHNNTNYFVTMLRHGRSVKYYKLHGLVGLPSDLQIRYRLSITQTITGRIHKFNPA